MKSCKEVKYRTNIDKKNKKAAKIEALRKVKPATIRARVEKESKEAFAKYQPKSWAALTKCREDYINYQVENIEEQMEDLKFKNSTRPDIFKQNVQSMVHNSLSTFGPFAKPSQPYPMVQSKTCLDAFTEQQTLDKAQAISIIKTCYLSQLDFSKIRKDLESLIHRYRANCQGTKEETNLLQELLAVKDKSNFKKIDRTLRKYYMRQNKFVSYRLYRENYVAVLDELVTVLETEEH